MSKPGKSGIEIINPPKEPDCGLDKVIAAIGNSIGIGCYCPSCLVAVKKPSTREDIVARTSDILDRRIAQLQQNILEARSKGDGHRQVELGWRKIEAEEIRSAILKETA